MPGGVAPPLHSLARSVRLFVGGIVTLGLYRNRSVARIKGNQATSIIHNGIILDLVCGFGLVVSVRMFRAEELSFEWSLYSFLTSKSLSEIR